jgi:hypothetical protein
MEDLLKCGAVVEDNTNQMYLNFEPSASMALLVSREADRLALKNRANHLIFPNEV